MFILFIMIAFLLFAIGMKVDNSELRQIGVIVCAMVALTVELREQLRKHITAATKGKDARE